MADRYLQIDADGFCVSDGIRWQGRDADEIRAGQEILKNIFIEGRVYKSRSRDIEFYLEAFDLPLVVSSVECTANGDFTLQFPYDYTLQMTAAAFGETLRLDEWDRFHGHRDDGVAFVFSRKAQAQLFDLFDEFDDESVTIAGKTYTVPPWLTGETPAGTEEFWTERYNEWSSTGEKPGWDLQGPTPALVDSLPQLKIMKASVAVLGAGAGHDAAYLAKLGHVVTAFDISEQAIARAKAQYPESENLKYVLCDALNIPDQYAGQFDLVFEHTFFCAIDPTQRSQAVKSYRRLLHEEGHLLGVFFAITITGTNAGGPPFGATEWELKKRMEKAFEFLYWTRWHHSPKGRTNWEVMVYGKKKAGI